MQWENLGISVLANVIFGVGSFLFYVLVVRIRNQKLIVFWNLGEHRALRVYLSRLQVQLGGSYGSAQRSEQPHTPMKPAKRPDFMDSSTTGATVNVHQEDHYVLPSGEVYQGGRGSDAYDDEVQTAGASSIYTNQFARKSSHATQPSVSAHAMSPHTAQSVPRSYQGDAVPKLEHEIAEDLVRTFYSAVGGRAGTDTLSSGLLRVHADAEIRVSPANIKDLDPLGTVVSFGSPGYNEVSEKIEELTNGAVSFIDDNRAIQLPAQELVLRGNRSGVIVRYFAEMRCWFYVAGPASLGTAAAAYFLVHSWDQLDRIRQHSESFWVAIESDPLTHKSARIIAEGALPQLSRSY